MLKESPLGLVLSDVNMPGESGLDFTREALAHYPDTAVVMVTGMDDRLYAEIATEFGAYGYVLKPFKPNELIINVGNAFRRRALEIENRDHRERLEQTVLERTAALRETIPQLESLRDRAEPPPGGDHPPALVGGRVPQPGDGRAHHPDQPRPLAARTTRRPRRRARPADPHRKPDARRGQDRHPDRILLKAGRLTDDERTVMEGHAEMGHRILAGSQVELLDLAALMALTHHERIDGTGYPADSPATRSRSRDGSRRSRTSSTRSPPTASTVLPSSRTRPAR